MIRILFWGMQKLGVSGEIFHIFQESEEPDMEYCRYLSIMQKADHIHQLDELLSYSTRKWPQWEKQIEEIYKRKQLLIIQDKFQESEGLYMKFRNL